MEIINLICNNILNWKSNGPITKIKFHDFKQRKRRKKLANFSFLTTITKAYHYRRLRIKIKKKYNTLSSVSKYKTFKAYLALCFLLVNN